MADEKQQLLAWMIQHSFATGHGDTFEDLLKQLTWQWEELRTKATFEANERAGDAANSAEKDARRKVAVEEMQPLLAPWGKMQPEKVDAIIKEAQG
jgi:hypothetical protein